MRDEIRLIFGDDGKARVYDDTYDVIIHCESEEEQKTAMERLASMTWIPCSERLPEEDQEVLATTNWSDVTFACRYDNNKWFIHEGNTNATTDDILAWMPMPEPYKGEQNGKA